MESKENRIESALKQRKEELHLLGTKETLSRRKDKDGSNAYQKTLDRVEEAEKELKSIKD